MRVQAEGQRGTRARVRDRPETGMATAQRAETEADAHTERAERAPRRVSHSHPPPAPLDHVPPSTARETGGDPALSPGG